VKITYHKTYFPKMISLLHIRLTTFGFLKNLNFGKKIRHLHIFRIQLLQKCQTAIAENSKIISFLSTPTSTVVPWHWPVLISPWVIAKENEQFVSLFFSEIAEVVNGGKQVSCTELISGWFNISVTGQGKTRSFWTDQGQNYSFWTDQGQNQSFWTDQGTPRLLDRPGDTKASGKTRGHQGFWTDQGQKQSFKTDQGQNQSFWTDQG
jgi:hypothetical protein